MTESRPRFCPRCGAAAVGSMPFCRNCGLDLTAGGPASRPPMTDEAPATPPSSHAATAAPSSHAAAAAPSSHAATPAPTTTRAATADVHPRAARVTERSSRFPPVIVAGLLVMLGLLGYGFLTRPIAPSSPGAPGLTAATATASAAASAPIVGLTILSPADGAAVATKDVNVIGTAPPGVTVTRDVSFGLDEHTTSDGTGHWSIRVGLKEGENKLVFRIGDDQSTRREIRVTYTPPSGG